MKSPGDRKTLSITNANENIKIVMWGLLKSGRWDYAGEKNKSYGHWEKMWERGKLGERTGNDIRTDLQSVLNSHWDALSVRESDWCKRSYHPYRNQIKSFTYSKDS